MVTDYLGQELGLGMVGRNYFCSTVSGSSSGRAQLAGVVSELVASILWRLTPSQVWDESMVGLSRTTDQWTYTWLLHVAWAPHRMVTGFLREHTKRDLPESEQSKSPRKEMPGFF